MSRRIALVNGKGGVGKTTTAVSMACGLGKLGHRVLLVDTDPQGNSTTYLGLGDHSGNDITDLLIGEVPFSKVVVEASDGIYVIPSLTAKSRNLENMLTNVIQAEGRLIESLQDHFDDFDFIIIDCPPSLGKITGNALICATDYIVPVIPEPLSLDGISAIFDFARLFKRANRELEFAGFVLTRYNKKERNSTRQAIASALRQYGYVFEANIRENKHLYDSIITKQSVFSSYPESGAAEDYLALCRELVNQTKTV